VVYSLFFIPPKNLGDPGSSRGTLEHIRVDLTEYSLCTPPQKYSLATRTEAFIKFCVETSAWIFLYVIISRR
jgi:hypothetical protein